MNETEKRKRRLCFTGHRPEKLGCDEATVRLELRKAIDAAIRSGYRTFITGMARGVDIWAGEIVLERRALYPDIFLICALPYPGFERAWKNEWKERYANVLACSDLIRVISPSFTIESFQRRNEWMVDHSSLVIAVFNGCPGGTRNTIEYAGRHGVAVYKLPV